MLLLAPASPVLAQSVDLGELRRCAGLPTDSLKLECFEALASAGSEEPGPTAGEEYSGDAAGGSQAEATPTEAPIDDALAHAAPLTAAAAADGRSPDAAPAASATPARPAEPEAEASASVADAAAEAGADDPLADWGIQDRGEPDVAHATVVEVTKARYGELVFHFDNGQVWQQQEKRYFPYPRGRVFDVTLSTGMMGEVRLQVEGAGRRETIKRLQ